MSEPHRVTTIRLTDRAFQELDIMKQTGHINNLSNFIEITLHEKFAKLFPAGRKQFLEEQERKLEEMRASLIEIEVSDKERDTKLERIFEGFKRRADEMGRKPGYERFQKAWLEQFVVELEGVNDVDSLFQIMETRRKLQEV